MKRGFFIWMAMPVIVLASCVSEEILSRKQEGDSVLTLRLEVDEMSTGVQVATRGTIPAEEGETTINSLYLLFYEYTSEGSGAWVSTVTGADLGAAPAMNAAYQIDFAANGLSEDASYTILALANITPNGDDANGFLDGRPVEEFIPLFQELTEREAVERTPVVLSGVGITEGDDGRAIQPYNLFMSARSVYRPDEDEVTVRLVRGVARFDIYLDETEVLPHFQLVSASIWSAAAQAPVWYDKVITEPARMQRFYGLKNSEGFAGGRIVGGLYALENFVPDPKADDKVTTCVVVGLKDVSDDGFGEVGKTYYYRINVNPMSSRQDLRRNQVYRLRINSVSSLGEENEYRAWSHSDIRLGVSINEWIIDDNGMVVTDGVNTMMLPVKLVRLDPQGDAREFSVFTIGTGALTISKKELPEGIEASLDRSLLQITATALAGGESERRGSIEVSYGSLRGTISFIQSPDQGSYLTLNRYEAPNFHALGRGGISDNVLFKVTASGPWTAQIYNLSDDAHNPGFSFSPAGEPATYLHSAQNPLGDLFQVYTTGDNASNSDVRNGFIMITLDANPTNFSRAVVLAQDPKSEIVLSPIMPSPMHFSPAGTPLGAGGATPREGFAFDINPGRNGSGVLNPWDITPNGGDTEYFEIEKITAGSVNRFIVRAKGTMFPLHEHVNLLDRTLTATFTITADSASKEFTVMQNAVDISLSTGSTQVSENGGLIQDVTVNIDPELHWTAAVETNFTPAGSNVDLPHAGYLSTDGENRGAAISDPQPQSTKLSAGFDKIYYPLVGETPRMSVRVSLAENPNVSATFTVTQNPLNPAPMNILDVRNTSYGSLTGSPHYLSFFRSYLTDAQMYGPDGRVKTATPPSITGQADDPVSISPRYAYLHVGGRPGSAYTQDRHTAVNNWFDSYGKERLVYYIHDDANDRLFANSTNAARRTTVLSELGISGGGHTSAGGGPVLNTDVAGTPIYKYLVEDGPFGPSGQFSSVSMDATSSRAYASTLPASAVPLIVERDNHENVLLFVDPVNNLIYQGESQLFDAYIEAPSITLQGGSTNAYANLSRFLANLLGYVVNASQYGTHYTELFLPGNEALYNDAFIE